MNTPSSLHDHANRSPLVREFSVYIKGQYASQLAGLYAKTSPEEDPNDFEEPIMVRSFFYRIMRTAFQRAGQVEDRDSDFISAAIAHQWAILDAADFRNLNRIDRNLCTHCAEIICANPSPFYQTALRTSAPDVTELAHAVRAGHAQRRAPPAPVTDTQGVLALPLSQNDQRPSVRLAPALPLHQR